MNLHYVQRDDSWIQAEKDCRSEFIEQMRDCQYGALETRDAWEWFRAGWQAAKGVKVTKP
jgi:hypothetical protein